MSDNSVAPLPNSNAAPGEESLTPGALAPAYVFEATDAAEADAVREAMAQSAEVGEEVQAYRRLFAAMLHSTPQVQPPPELGAKLLQAIQPPVAPIAQRYLGATTPVDPLEAMQVVTLIPPPGTAAPASAGERVNPLTGKPMASAPPLATSTSAAPSTATKKAPPAAAASVAAAKSQTKAPPYVPYQAPKPASQQGARPYTAPPRSAATKPAGPRTGVKKIEPIPAGFALTPLPTAAAQATSARRAGMWAAWGVALVALLLLFVSNSYWATQNTTLAQHNAQLQAESAAAQETVSSAQTQLTAALDKLQTNQTTISNLEAALATTQGELVSTQNELDLAQQDLATTRAQVADSAAQLAALQANAGTGADMTISDDMVNMLATGTMQQASLGALDANQEVSATARILWNPDLQSGMLVAMEMPPLQEGQAYQLWLLRGGVPTSAGMFTVDDTGMGMMEMDEMNPGDFEVAAITPEPAAGSPSPTGPIVIAGEL